MVLVPEEVPRPAQWRSEAGGGGARQASAGKVASDDSYVTDKDLAGVLEFIVGDVYRLAPVEVTTVNGKVEQYVLKGAPNGVLVIPSTGEIVAVPSKPTITTTDDGVVVVGLHAQAATQAGSRVGMQVLLCNCVLDRFQSFMILYVY